MTWSHSADANVTFGAGSRARARMGVAMLELHLLALEMAAAYRFTGVSPNPAPWPKASVTLVPPAMTIDVELRQAPSRNNGLFESGVELPYVPPVGVVPANTLHSQSQ